MKYFIITVLIQILLVSVTADVSPCKIITSKRARTMVVTCTELTSLGILQKIKPQATTIEISDSTIPTIMRSTFAKFGSSLVTLNIHGSGVKTIQEEAFKDLAGLRRLILWGNKLESVEANWFQNTGNLRTLDLSFNLITRIDPSLSQKLPYLENFYFDYNQIKFINFNMFGYFPYLKRVKFGKNPLSWPYRANLIWQFENQHVQYNDEWEDWSWMNVVVKDCMENGQADVLNDSALDCVVERLLNFTYEAVPKETKQQYVGCYVETRRLVSCMRPKNSTGNTDNETARKILEDYAAVLKPISRAQNGLSCDCNSCVVVHTLNGERLKIFVPYMESVEFLKQQLAEFFNERDQRWNPERMRLWMNGYYLENNRTISDYNLSPEDRIFLLLNNY